jgi:hypothetical protein
MARRRQIAAALFYGAGGASARVVHSIYALLELTAPDALHSEAPCAGAPEAATPVLAGYETRTSYHA